MSACGNLPSISVILCPKSLVDSSPGLLGRYYAARHSHGQYRSCAVTGVYYFDGQDFQNFQKHLIEFLKFSLGKTIERHPALCYGLLEKTKNSEAQFVRLQTIRWEDIVEIHTSTSEDKVVALPKVLGLGHQHLFKDQRQKPAWKIIVLLHDNGSLTSNSSFRADIISHHAIADGISGSAFHKTLLEAFYQASLHSKSQNGWPYLVPPSSLEPLAIEKAFPFTQGISAPSTNTGTVQ